MLVVFVPGERVRPIVLFMGWTRARRLVVGWTATCRVRFGSFLKALLSLLLVLTVVATGAAGTGAKAWGGDLRLGYAEFAELLHGVIGDRYVLVSCAGASERQSECKEKGQIEFGIGSEPAFSHAQTLATLEAPQFSLFGGRYQFWPEATFALRIEVRAQVNGLLLIVNVGEDAGFAAVCLAGACTDAALLPRIVWRSGSLSVLVSPAKRSPHVASRSGTPQTESVGASLELAAVSISGQFTLVCPGGFGLAPAVCAAIRAAVGSDVTGLVRARIEGARQRVNAKGLGAAVSSVFGGSAGSPDAFPTWLGLRIWEITADTSGVLISFCLPAACS